MHLPTPLQLTAHYSVLYVSMATMAGRVNELSQGKWVGLALGRGRAPVVTRHGP